MSVLVYVAVHIVKPALFTLMILSCLMAIYLTTTNKGAKRMRKVDAQQIRKMIKVFGRAKVRAILKEKGLTFKDLGIT